MSRCLQQMRSLLIVFHTKLMRWQDCLQRPNGQHIRRPHKRDVGRIQDAMERQNLLRQPEWQQLRVHHGFLANQMATPGCASEVTRHPAPVTRHTSHVTRHTSHATRHFT
jgi:hypothetical protein